ncbi:DUF962 domain-containing protein [Mucilaginibacter sp. OK283]|uniref:Mpo1 family 2-hydroxy fatty acid dioxygenase n=1 Tax=Mucilaginibacter sp. OK283 TaxID=1881049 RepID=UPI0008C93977|nr:Mpo1-like protein [Mucilaginibacter sp. OK283]SEO45046.1 Protein of unknown function [Mucilaginibacter sp. OK283]
MASKKTANNKTGTQADAKANESIARQYINKYVLSHQDPINQVIHYICVPLLMFSIFGLLWAIPFPYFKFLGTYNGYFNWASFAIAIAVYYYLRISPLISYTMLFVLLGFSYLIMTLLSWQTTGGPAMWLVCLIVFIPSACLVLIGNSREKTFAQYGFNLKLLPIAPVYLVYILLKKFGINS